jgi:DNA topoisomerase 2-associated protein PAT1
MTQSDKDFITRIQVSQLISADPYGSDFYAQVFGTVQRTHLGTGENDAAIINFGNYGGIGVGLPPGHKGAGRRESALNKMVHQIERIVKNQRNRAPPSQGMSLVGLLADTKYSQASS